MPCIVPSGATAGFRSEATKVVALRRTQPAVGAAYGHGSVVSEEATFKCRSHRRRPVAHAQLRIGVQ